LQILLLNMMGINELSSCENINGALCACTLLHVDHRAREALGLLQLCEACVSWK
jgi:hypothetical protein